jgi:DUF917 family protein
MGRILTMQDVEAAVRGGSVFACGGGGWAEHGRELGSLAVTIGRPELVTMDEVPDDAWIATAAAIGAPGGLTDWQMLGIDYVKAAQRLQDALGERIYGLIIGQNGMSSTLNGWLPSAVLGTKVVDAVGDIRAHPTGDMGSLGLAGSPEPMIQCAVGGNRASNSYMELTVHGATGKVSPVLRKAADMAGGFIASCRNPIRASAMQRWAASARPWRWARPSSPHKRAGAARSSTRSAKPRRARSSLPARWCAIRCATPKKPSTSAPSKSAKAPPSASSM